MSNAESTETVVLGGGCFWCIEPVFTALRGVVDVFPGYSGGHVSNPTYEQVCDQNTGHIEVIQIRFDPAVISFDVILEVFFATHDPTTVDRQGADVGPQYASVIFYQSPEQKGTAERLIQETEHLLGKKVVTKLLAAQAFWPAEDYHHDYYAKYPTQGYCQIVIAPKLAKFRQHFSQLLAD